MRVILWTPRARADLVGDGKIHILTVYQASQRFPTTRHLFAQQLFVLVVDLPAFGLVPSEGFLAIESGNGFSTAVAIALFEQQPEGRIVIDAGFEHQRRQVRIPIFLDTLLQHH